MKSVRFIRHKLSWYFIHMLPFYILDQLTNHFHTAVLYNDGFFISIHPSIPSLYIFNNSPFVLCYSIVHLNDCTLLVGFVFTPPFHLLAFISPPLLPPLHTPKFQIPRSSSSYSKSKSRSSFDNALRKNEQIMALIMLHSAFKDQIVP